MNILTIPVRNLKRKFLRTILLIFIFTIGILSMVTINNISQSVGEGLEKKLNQFGSNILIYPINETLSVSYGGFDLGSLSYNVKYLSGSRVINSVRNIELNKNISVVAPKLITLENYLEQPVVIIGVDWNEELKIKNHWIIKGNVPSEQLGILSGSGVAEYYGFVIGDTVRLGTSDYKVTGILHQTGSDDDKVLFMDIAHLQDISGKTDLVNFVEIAALCSGCPIEDIVSGCPIEDIVSQISAKLPYTDIRTLQSVVRQRMSAVSFVKRLASTVSLVILLTASFMIALFMFASVNERKEEIGVLRSLGFSKFSIFNIFCFEALFIGLISGVLGYIFGYFVGSRAVNLMNIGEDISIYFNFSQFILTIVIVVVLSVIASLVPAWKASKVDPSEALVML
jgi:putative ABC transport system permease protein